MGRWHASSVRRWWWAILLAVIVIVVRGALPSILRSQIETRASEALHAKVHVGDVGPRAPRPAASRSNDVSVRALDARAGRRADHRRGSASRWISAGCSSSGRRSASRPSSWIEPHVALDRLQSGDINLLALVPKRRGGAGGGEARGREGSEPEPSGWHFGDRLRRAPARRRPLPRPARSPVPEPLALNLESIEAARHRASSPRSTASPSDIRFVVKLDQGALRTRARFTPLKGDGGVAVDVTAQRHEARRSTARASTCRVWRGAISTGLVSLGSALPAGDRRTERGDAATIAPRRP